MNQLPLQFPSRDRTALVDKCLTEPACSGFTAHGPDLIPKLAQLKAQGFLCWRLDVDGAKYHGLLMPVADCRSLEAVTEAIRTVRPVAVRWNGMHLEPIE